MFEQIKILDRQLFLLVNNGLANTSFDILMPQMTKSSFWLVPLLIAGTIYWRRAGRFALVVMTISILLIGLSDLFSVRVLKPLFERFRPCDPRGLVEGGRFLVGNLRSLSFPSSHAFNSAAFAFFYSVILPKRKWYFFTLTLLIGFTRVYVGVHYPLDVISGWIIGGGFGVVGGILTLRLLGRPRKE